MVNKIGTMLMGFMLLVGVGAIGDFIDTHYTREAIVIEVQDDDVVILLDSTGNEWEFLGDNFEIDDKVRMYMFNGCTNNTLKDDEVLNVKKL